MRIAVGPPEKNCAFDSALLVLIYQLLALFRAQLIDTKFLLHRSERNALRAGETTTWIVLIRAKLLCRESSLPLRHVTFVTTRRALLFSGQCNC